MFSIFLLLFLLTVGAEKASAKDVSQTSGTASQKPLQCGVSTQLLPKNSKEEGQVTSGQFPWIAAIYRSDNGIWAYACSGTLISKHIVLTSAYCLMSSGVGEVKPEEVKVGLGTQNYLFESNETHSILADVREVVIHNHYNGNKTRYAFDVALLDLAINVKLTPHINPACLLGEGTKNDLTGKGYISGWTENINESQTLQLSFFDYATCLEKLSANPVYLRYLSQDKMCAERNSRIEAVRGLGGAGLTADIQGAHYVVGVLSIKLSFLYVLTDMKHEGNSNWLKTEKTRLDVLH